MSAEPSAEGGGVLPFPSAETITGSHSGSRPGSVERPIQPARLPDAQTDATAHLPSGITDRTLRQKLYDNVWTAYWLEFIMLIIALFVGAIAGALIGIFLFPSASPICSFSRVGDWGPWKECEPICGQKRTRSRNRTLFDLETIDDHKPCINAIETDSCHPLMCCDEKYRTDIKGDSVHCYNFVETAYTWTQARELAGKDRVAKLASIHNKLDSSMVANTARGSIWIGLRCFRAGYCKWDDGSELDYYDRNLMAADDFPPNVSVACALYELSYTVRKLVWRLVPCNERHHFVNVSLVVPKNRPKCSKSPAYCYDFQTPHRFYDVDQNKLAVVNNWLQSEFLKTLMTDKPADVKYWLGLRCVVDVNEVDGDQYSDWDQGCRWPDNSSIAFSNWAWGEQAPTFHKHTIFCVLIDNEGRWHNEPCGNSHPYMEENESHCDKVGQFIWSHWQTCPDQNQITIQKSNYTRYRQTNVISNSSNCPQFAPTIEDPYLSKDTPTYEYTQPGYQLEIKTFDCSPYGGPKADVRCHSMLWEYFDYCYQIGDRPSTPGDTKYGAVMITSEQEAKYVIDMIKKRSDNKHPESLFHIGLRCSKSHFEYCYWIHNWIWQKLSFHMFADGEPRVTDDRTQCVALRMPQEDWVSVYCDQQISTIWEYRPYCDKNKEWNDKYKNEGEYGPLVCDAETGLGVMKPWEKFNCPNNEEIPVYCPPPETCDLLGEKEFRACYEVVTFGGLNDALLELNSPSELNYVLELVHQYMHDTSEINLDTVFITGMFYDGNAWRSASLGTEVSSDVVGLLPDMGISTDQIHRLVIHAKKTISYVTAELSSELWEEQYTKTRRQGIILEQQNVSCDKFIQFDKAQYEWKYGKCGWDWEIAVHPDNFLNCAINYKREIFGECCAAGAVTGAQLSACYKLESTKTMSTQAQVFPRNKIINGAVPDKPAINVWKGMAKIKNQMAFINVHCNKTDTSDDWQCYGNGYRLKSDNIFAPKCKKLTSQTMCVLMWNKNELVAHNPDYQLKKYILQFQRFEENGEEKSKNCGFEGTDMKRCPRV